MKTQLEIGGMMCAACVEHVTKALQNVPQVRSVHVQNNPDIAIVEHDGANVSVLIAAVEDEGYQRKSLHDNEELQQRSHVIEAS